MMMMMGVKLKSPKFAHVHLGWGSELKYGLMCREIQIRLHKFCTADKAVAFVLFALFPDTPFSSTKGLLSSAYVWK